MDFRLRWLLVMGFAVFVFIVDSNTTMITVTKLDVSALDLVFIFVVVGAMVYWCWMLASRWQTPTIHTEDIDIKATTNSPFEIHPLKNGRAFLTSGGLNNPRAFINTANMSALSRGGGIFVVPAQLVELVGDQVAIRAHFKRFDWDDLTKPWVREFIGGEETVKAIESLPKFHKDTVRILAYDHSETLHLHDALPPADFERVVREHFGYLDEITEARNKAEELIASKRRQLHPIAPYLPQRGESEK